jgi:transcriptional regulator with XRE-family HTH domain
MASLAERFAYNVKRQRQELGWSQLKLAQASGVDIRTVGRLENNDGSITFERAAAFAEAMGVDLAVLFDTPIGSSLPDSKKRKGEISSAKVIANVRARREEKGFSQAVLAQRAGIHRNHLSHAEKGERKLYLTTIEKLAAGLDVKPSELL